MGWYYADDHYSRSDLIQSLTETIKCDGITATCLRHTARGNVLWAVWEKTSSIDGATQRYLMCYLLVRSGNGLWGYKPISEAMGPNYHTCPRVYLDMTPVENISWRSAVQEYHKNLQAKRKSSSQV